jgi:hypothetical protein
MGATEFTCVGNGKTAKEAFDAAVEDAAYDCGHGGYTGTIAEKDTFVMCSSEVFASQQEAFDFADKLLSDGDKRVDDKWGPAGCVAFKNKHDKVSYIFFGWASY